MINHERLSLGFGVRIIHSSLAKRSHAPVTLAHEVLISFEIRDGVVGASLMMFSNTCSPDGVISFSLAKANASVIVMDNKVWFFIRLLFSKQDYVQLFVRV